MKTKAPPHAKAMKAKGIDAGRALALPMLAQYRLPSLPVVDEAVVFAKVADRLVRSNLANAARADAEAKARESFLAGAIGIDKSFTVSNQKAINRARERKAYAAFRHAVLTRAHAASPVQARIHAVYRTLVDKFAVPCGRAYDLALSAAPTAPAAETAAIIAERLYRSENT